jgi:hypothetical protein
VVAGIRKVSHRVQQLQQAPSLRDKCLPTGVSETVPLFALSMFGDAR